MITKIEKCTRNTNDVPLKISIDIYAALYNVFFNVFNNLI